jgi:outer membrane protein TolC
MAEKNRLEIKLAKKQVEVAEKEVDLTKKDFYPSVNLTGTYFRAGDEFTTDGGAGINDPEGWNIGAVASWDFWEWGRTVYGKKEKLSRLSQAEYRKENLLDNIRLEVKEAYLQNVENEINIITLQKAVEQAEENYRIFQERYKEQVTTSTDVLIAQTLLARTQVNFFSALYDFKISKAALYRAMGLEYYE